MLLENKGLHRQVQALEKEKKTKDEQITFLSSRIEATENESDFKKGELEQKCKTVAENQAIVTRLETYFMDNFRIAQKACTDIKNFKGDHTETQKKIETIEDVDEMVARAQINLIRENLSNNNHSTVSIPSTFF